MDLNYTPSEIQFRDGLRGWLATNVPADWNGSQGFDYLRRWQRRLYEGGWAGVSWPREYGGRGATVVEQVIFLEEMARASAPPLANVLGLSLIGPTIIAHGSDAQKRRYLPNILSAEEIWCQGFSEPNAGSDLANLSTEARRDGAHFIVNGQKVWTSYGHVGDWCELVVRTDPAAPKHKGLSVLLVDMHSPGVEVRPLRQMTGESEFSELFFHDVRVPVENVLGAVNDGWNVALGTLMHERATLGAAMHITYTRQFDRLIGLTHRLGRDQDPVIRQKLAQVYSEIEVLRLNQMRAVSRISSSGTPGPEGSIQKIFWSELNQRFQQVAQEILGPFGQLEKGSDFAIDGGQWAYQYLRARGNTIEAGTSEVQRNIIGHFVLGLPRSY
jgi:alkylation response protein AidB-like acyl-CoA dehydrogenase